MSLASKPSLGAVLLLVVLVVALVSGGDEERGGRGGDGRERAGDAGGRAGGEGGGNERGGGSRAGEPGGGGTSEGGGGSDGGGSGGDGSGGGAAGVVVPVVDVVDGDTIEVILGGREEDVRYIGVDTPESVAPGEPVECFGKRASEFNAGLVAGERVRLTFDAERRDQYGRLLAYVYLGERFVNAELLREGLARTLAISPNTSFAARFDQLEQQAANAGRGLWGACGP